MTDYIKREDCIKRDEDYIKRKDVKKKAYDLDNNFVIDLCDVNMIPPADVAPIRHGSWKEIFYGEAGGYTFFNVVCNCCGYDMGDKMTPFCPNCGTKMDGELIRDERIF